MGNVPSKPSNGSTYSSTPSSPAAGPESTTVLSPTRASFSVDSRLPRETVQRSNSYTAGPFASRNQNNDSGNSGKRQNELALAVGSNSPTATAGTKSTVLEANQALSNDMAALFDKPLPVSPMPAASSALESTRPESPPALPDKDTIKGRQVEAILNSKSDSSLSKTIGTMTTPPLNSDQGSYSGPSLGTRMMATLTQQSIHSQSSLSDKSITSNSSGSSGSGSGSGSGRTVTTRTTSVTGGTTESLGQLGLQRFPTGESECKSKPMSRKAGDDSLKQNQSHDAQAKSSRTTSMVSSSSARSSSGSSGFKFPKPNLSFKPLLYSQSNDSKSQQQLYQQHSSSSTSALPSAHRQQQQQPALDSFANSPFPSVLLSIELPQSLLDKYVIDLEGFRHGKGIWGIGKYSWTITVLARANGKKYVIKRVSKALLPPTAYYQYPTTAHRLCTCPACKSSREQLLLAGQLDQNELKNIQEVLVIHNKGRKKELPQLPPTSSQQLQHEQKQPARPLSAGSVYSPVAKDNKEQRRSFQLYRCHNTSSPNSQGKTTLSADSTPQDTPASSRPSTPSPSPLCPSSSSPPSTAANAGKIHNRSQSHGHSKVSPATNATTHSPLLPSATPLSWPHKGADSTVAQGTRLSTDFPSRPASNTPHFRSPPKSAGAATGHKKKPTLQRRVSTPSMSRAVTGLNVLEDDPSRLGQLKRLSRDNSADWHPRNGKGQRLHADVDFVSSVSDRRLFDSPVGTVPTMTPTLQVETADGKDNENNENQDKAFTAAATWSEPAANTERRVSPFDTNEGEFKQMEPEAPPDSTPRANGLSSFVPPPHALPMELVLLQTYNDSDHLPEHHEWTQDQDYWYYVTKAHGVQRRKLKKVSSWWLDMGSLSSALLSGSSSSSEPIATGPIYNMGRATPGASSPLPSSPLSSEVALSSTDEMTNVGGELSTKEPGSSAASVAFAFKKQSSPRSSSHMGKYYHVDWEEYISL
ncbi:hypothetical protein BGX28_010154 [Mortierella sp. GBA30]|nr:hypothetical protein BGX28_010154 [Mortierella sp. GBA30]